MEIFGFCSLYVMTLPSFSHPFWKWSINHERREECDEIKSNYFSSNMFFFLGVNERVTIVGSHTKWERNEHLRVRFCSGTGKSFLPTNKSSPRENQFSFNLTHSTPGAKSKKSSIIQPKNSNHQERCFSLLFSSNMITAFPSLRWSLKKTSPESIFASLLIWQRTFNSV